METNRGRTWVYMMEYKGYIAKVEYDDSVGLLHASVVNSGAYPVANCEAADAESLRREFRISIDEYLASCEEDGVEPRRAARWARARAR